MKKKWILRVVWLLVLVFMAAIVAIAFSLDAIVKKGVETIGPTATQVDVKIKSVGVSIFSARAELAGIVLGNPAGYKTPTAITVDDVSVSVKPGSVFSDKLVVENITVKSPVITLEGGLKDNNLTKIENNLNNYIGGSSAPPKSSPSPPAAGPAKPQRKLQVNELLLTGAKLQVNTKLTGSRTLTLSIPDIHLTDLGSGPDGITAVEVGQRTLRAVLDAATTAIAKNAGQLGTEAASGAKGAVKKATDSLKGLFH